MEVTRELTTEGTVRLEDAKHLSRKGRELLEQVGFKQPDLVNHLIKRNLISQAEIVQTKRRDAVITHFNSFDAGRAEAGFSGNLGGAFAGAVPSHPQPVSKVAAVIAESENHGDHLLFGAL